MQVTSVSRSNFLLRFGVFGAKIQQALTGIFLTSLMFMNYVSLSITFYMLFLAPNMVLQYDYPLFYLYSSTYSSSLGQSIGFPWASLRTRMSNSGLGSPVQNSSPPPLYKTHFWHWYYRNLFIYCDTAPYTTIFHHQEVTNIEAQYK